MRFHLEVEFRPVGAVHCGRAIKSVMKKARGEDRLGVVSDLRRRHPPVVFGRAEPMA
jgi:hypothetical protein